MFNAFQLSVVVVICVKMHNIDGDFGKAKLLKTCCWKIDGFAWMFVCVSLNLVTCVFFILMCITENIKPPVTTLNAQTEAITKCK